MEDKKKKSELVDEILMWAIELEERLNKASLIALHYHGKVDVTKSVVDHLDEVYAYLKSEGLVGNKEFYTRVRDYFSKELKKINMKTYEIIGKVNYNSALLSSKFSAIVSEETKEEAKNLLEKKLKEELKEEGKSIQGLTIQSLTIDKITEINPNKKGVLSYNISPHR